MWQLIGNPLFQQESILQLHESMVFPTLVYVALWLWFFGLDLIGSF
jgi:hypothetical protein